MSDLTLRSLQGKSLAEKLEIAGRWAGADGRTMDGIWRTESQRGDPNWMTSSAGARGHFGLMPPTMATWSERLGFQIDPDNFDHALIAGAYTLKENLGRFGNLPDALRAYNGGWDRSKWNNPETASYVGAVLGGAAAGGGAGRVTADRGPAARPQAPLLDVSRLDAGAVLGGEVTPTGPQFPGARPAASLDPAEVLAGTPGDYGNYRPPERTRTRQSEAQSFIGQLGGFKPFADPNANSNVGSFEMAAENTNSVAGQVYTDSFSFTDKLAVGVMQNTITGQLLQAIDETIPARDPDFDYEANMSTIEEGRNRRQRIELRERATSLEDAQRIIARQDKDAAFSDIMADAPILNFTTSLADPAGYLLGGVVGKTIQVGGLGSRVLFASGQRTAGTLSIVGEGVVGNLAGTAIIDRIAGQYQAPEDYAISGLFGGLMGTAAVPFVSRSALRGGRLNASATRLQEAFNASEADIMVQAINRAGPDAPVPQIEQAAAAIRQERVVGTLNDSFSPIPEENRLFTAEDAEAIDMVAREGMIGELGLNALSDDAQRALAANLVDNSRRIVQANPIADISGDTGVLRNMGLASTGETLLRQNDDVAKAIGLVLTEGTTGRGGRRHSASITASLNERRFMRPILEYEDQFHLYRQSKGVGWMQFAFGDGSIRQNFDIEVAAEMRARARPDLYATTAPESVRKAADYMADGYRLMGEEQVRAGTLGSQNIKPGDPSYFPQHISSAKLQRLTETQKSAFRGIVADQARTIFGWDAKFSKMFGARYLESAIDRAAGNYDVPVNLTHQSSSGFVEDLLESMRAGASKEDMVRLDKAGQRFARGGAGYTKGRLNFDVMSTYKLEDGTEVKLLDIMDTDMVGMYRAYARRSAGEIALQQYGIAGSHGLKSIRAYLKVAHDAKRIDNAGMDAFDQIAAEFLNTPFGKHQGQFMDNLRIITSTIKLGGMGVTQFGEYGNGIAALGVGRVLTSIKDLPRMIKEVGVIRKGGEVDGLLRSIEKQQGFEVGLDSWIMTRALDVKDNDVQMYGREGLGLGTRVVRGASHAQAILSGHRMITAVQTRGMSEQILHKAMRFIRDGQEDVSLKDMGFSPEIRATLKANMDKIATFDNSGNLTKFDLFGGDLTPAQRQEVVAVINRASSQIIQGTYIGETGKWAHDGFLKLLFQFRTFSLTAVEKQWGRNLNNYGALKSMMFLAGAMSFAAPIHMARVHARMLGMNEQDREEYADKYLSPFAIAQATMTYASAAGFAGDIWDIGGSAATNIMGDAAPEWVQGTVNPRGGARGQGKLLGGVVAPSASIAEDAYGLVNGDISRLKALMPGANLPYVVPLLNAIESAAEDE